MSSFSLISNLPTKVICLTEDNCFGPFSIQVLYHTLWRCTVWWSAYVLFNERTRRSDFKIHNVMCVFMDKYFLPDYFEVPSESSLIKKYVCRPPDSIATMCDTTLEWIVKVSKGSWWYGNVVSVTVKPSQFSVSSLIWRPLHLLGGVNHLNSYFCVSFSTGSRINKDFISSLATGMPTLPALLAARYIYLYLQTPILVLCFLLKTIIVFLYRAISSPI